MDGTTAAAPRGACLGLGKALRQEAKTPDRRANAESLASDIP